MGTQYILDLIVIFFPAYVKKWIKLVEEPSGREMAAVALVICTLLAAVNIGTAILIKRSLFGKEYLTGRFQFPFVLILSAIVLVTAYCDLAPFIF